MKYEIFECQCYLPEHRLIFALETNEEWLKLGYDDPPELYTEIYLTNYRNVFQRIWVAIQYIFGVNPKYGYFANWSMKAEDAYRLKELTNKFIELYQLWYQKEVDQNHEKER